MHDPQNMTFSKESNSLKVAIESKEAYLLAPAPERGEAGRKKKKKHHLHLREELGKYPQGRCVSVEEWRQRTYSEERQPQQEASLSPSRSSRHSKNRSREDVSYLWEEQAE